MQKEAIQKKATPKNLRKQRPNQHPPPKGFSCCCKNLPMMVGLIIARAFTLLAF